jgi:hypothetical protein
MGRTVAINIPEEVPDAGLSGHLPRFDKTFRLDVQDTEADYVGNLSYFLQLRAGGDDAQQRTLRRSTGVLVQNLKRLPFRRQFRQKIPDL